MEILPLLIGVISNAKCLTLAVRIDQRYRECVVFRIHAPIVAEAQRPIYGGMGDGSPEVNNLESATEKRGGVGRWEVAVDSRDGGRICLIYMRLRNGLPPVGTIVDLANSPTAYRCWGWS